jgi:hypothetical protein
MLTAAELMRRLAAVPRDTPIRVGDVSEHDDLHCSVGRVVHRSGCIVLVPGNDDIWQDETLASDVLSKTLWPEEKEDED